MELNMFIVFLSIATAITISVEILKTGFIKFVDFIDAIKKEKLETTKQFPLGIISAIGFSFWGIFTYNAGLIEWLGVQSNSQFHYFDLTVTALIISGGSSKLYEFLKIIREGRQKFEEK